MDYLDNNVPKFSKRRMKIYTPEQSDLNQVNILLSPVVAVKATIRSEIGIPIEHTRQSVNLLSSNEQRPS